MITFHGIDFGEIALMNETVVALFQYFYRVNRRSLFFSASTMTNSLTYSGYVWAVLFYDFVLFFQDFIVATTFVGVLIYLTLRTRNSGN